jgi:hypothetical protein
MSSPHVIQGHGSSTNQDDLNVEISMSARADLTGSGGIIVSRLVHAVSVAQPVQSWTVIREHGDFITLGHALSSMIGGVPSCPVAPAFDSSGTSDYVHEIRQVRNAAQNWLSNVLLFPGARESPAVRQFLCYGANLVPSQFQGINWIPFTDTSSSPGATGTTATTTATQNPNHSRGEDELYMDDMFMNGHVDDHHDEADEVDDYEDDEAHYFSATERYQPTEEAVTQDDVMEFQNNADDVEMIEDIGSLAQSLGASHLGQSLQLQAELAGGRPNLPGAEMRVPPQQGLNIGGFVANNSTSNGMQSVGGIGNAVEKADVEVKVEGFSDSFYQKKPISAPRLDSFRMIKVVGKGSFGKFMLCFTRHLSPRTYVQITDC